jgi:hypothetical protein
VRIADSADNLDTVATNITNVNTVATNITNVNSVATNIANVNAVAANETNINAVKNNSTNINAVNANKTNIDTVAGNNANVTTVAGISANVTTVAGISANVTSVAGNATNINAVAGNATNINAVNANKTNIDAVAGNSSNINSAVSNASNINSAVANMAAIIDAPTQAANAASSAAAAAASAASGMYSAVQDKSANYTVVVGDAGDLIRVTTTSGAITITLPLISTVSDGFKVAVVKWTSDANVVNIARSGSNTINGATSAQIGSQYSQIIFVADFETNTWFASQSGLGATNVNVDNFSGNGSTTAFTLSSDPSSKNNTYVSISGVYQAKSTYSVSGTTLTFSTAPPTGTSNIEVVYGTPLAIGTPSDGTVTAAKMATGAAVGNLGFTPANVADGLAISGNNEYNATTTLTTANFGQVVYSNTTNNTTLTLPSVTGNNNKIITVSNLNTGIVTIVPASGGIYANGQQNLSSLTLSKGDSVQLAVEGLNWKALSGGNRKLIKITRAFSSSTRAAYGNNNGGVVSGQNFVYPTGGNLSIPFVKESSTSNIVISWTLSIGNPMQTHVAAIWKSNDTSVFKRFNYDYGNGISARGFVDSGETMFTGLAAGSHTFYFAQGRSNDTNITGYTLNINASDNADKSGDTTSEIFVYEYES